MVYDSVWIYFLFFIEEGYIFLEVIDIIICCLLFVWDGLVEFGCYVFVIGVEMWYNGEVVGEDVRKMVIEVDFFFFLISINFISGLNVGFQFFFNLVSLIFYFKL